MSRKPSLLAAAIKTEATASSEPTLTDTLAEPRPVARPAPAAGSYVAPSRANKSAKTHYLPPAYWETLEELSFRTRDGAGKRVPQERLVAEALNLLFLKYNYPQVRDGGH